MLRKENNMKSELIKPIYKLNGHVLDILRVAKNLIEEDPEKASDMLNVSIKAISNINDELTIRSEIQQIIEMTTENNPW